MSLFAPFRGERYADPTALGRRLAPPYDVIGPTDRAALAARDPCNIVHVDLPVAPPGADPYAAAAQTLAAWRSRGVVIRDGEPCAYVLRTSARLPDGSVRARTGVFLAVAAEPFSQRRIRPHERTHAGPKEDRRRLTKATGCNLSPVFLLAPDASGALAASLGEATTETPWAHCDALSGTHEVWVVRGPLARRIADAAGAESAYVADGHHRFETAVLFRDEAPPPWRAGAERTLSHVVSFRDPGLEILPTHRLVQGSAVEARRFAEAAAPYFSEVPAGREVFSICFAGGTELRLAPRAEADWSTVRSLPEHPAVRALPVTLADAVLVGVVGESLLGDAPALAYTADAAEARAVARAGRCAFSILLPPTRLDEVRRVADAGQIMPPKSTFFAPKVPTGVVLRPLDAEA